MAAKGTRRKTKGLTQKIRVVEADLRYHQMYLRIELRWASQRMEKIREIEEKLMALRAEMQAGK